MTLSHPPDGRGSGSPAVASPPEFTPPGPGRWELDRSHFAGGTTPIAQWWMSTTIEAGMGRVFAELGTPAAALRARFVHGFMYTRLVPLIGGEKPPRKLPPKPLLKAAARLHPAFRARRAAAQRALDERPWVAVNERWEHELKPALVARNRALQDIALGTLDDASLQAHIDDTIEHCRANCELHFWLHGYDLGPLANYVHSCLEWGITGPDALAALAGASPSTSAPAERLAQLRALVEASGARPATLDDVRAVSPRAAALLDAHLDERGWHLVTRYDIDGLALEELPGVVLASILEAAEPPHHDHVATAARLRDRVPVAARAEFDALLADARGVMDLRDDNGPNTYEWPAGLVRRALLEAARRLAARGLLSDPEHVFDIEPSEARGLFTGSLPAAGVLAQRWAARTAAAQLDPPLVLGPEEPTPPLEVLPAPLPRMVTMVQTALEQMGMAARAADRDPLAGVGVGAESYTGRVRRAASPEDAIASMEPGDVLVVRATSPAFNSVLGVAGAVVTADGGAMSHAAVLARELGIPAVVGAPGALDLRDGDTVEVDPRLGRVRVVAAR